MRIPGGGQIQQRGRQEQRCGLEQAAFLGAEAPRAMGWGLVGGEIQVPVMQCKVLMRF